VIFEQQIIMLNEELAKLKGQQQSQNPMMENSVWHFLYLFLIDFYSKTTHLRICQFWRWWKIMKTLTKQ